MLFRSVSQSRYGSSLVVAGGSAPRLVNSSASSVVLASAGPGSNTPVILNSDLSALSIRATEYLQRWKEVVQFSSKDYSDQMSAQFGIKAP